MELHKQSWQISINPKSELRGFGETFPYCSPRIGGDLARGCYNFAPSNDWFVSRWCSKLQGPHEQHHHWIIWLFGDFSVVDEPNTFLPPSLTWNLCIFQEMMDNPKNMTQIHARNKKWHVVLSGTSLHKLPCPAETGRPPKKVRHTTKLSQYESRDGNIHLTPNQRQPPQKKRSVAFYVHCFQKKTTKIAKSFKNLGPIIAPPNLLLSKKKKKHPKKNEPLGFFSMWDRSTCEFHPQTPLRESPTNKPPSRLFVWPLHPAIVANEGFVWDSRTYNWNVIAYHIKNDEMILIP